MSKLEQFTKYRKLSGCICYSSDCKAIQSFEQAEFIHSQLQLIRFYFYWFYSSISHCLFSSTWCLLLARFRCHVVEEANKKKKNNTENEREENEFKATECVDCVYVRFEWWNTKPNISVDGMASKYPNIKQFKIMQKSVTIQFNRARHNCSKRTKHTETQTHTNKPIHTICQHINPFAHDL